MAKPIIQSLLDLDFYKLTMAQVAWKCFRGAPVKYSFTNRTKQVALADFIADQDLRRELESIRGLKFTAEEIAYLRESRFIPKGMFSEKFLEFLEQLQLANFQLARDGGNFQITVSGKWPEAILWETLILSAVNELYYRGLFLKKGKSRTIAWMNEGQRRLNSKIQMLMLKPAIQISDFGARRRFSRIWQEVVVENLAKKIPNQFLGTSNVFLAKKFGLRPIGTFAHELYMVLSRIYKSDEEIRDSHNIVLQVWWQEYGEPLSIALTDTYGTDFFFRDFTPEQARAWKGLRQDSGDPFAFGEKAIVFYKKFGIDPKTKIIVFSDGLDLDTIIRLYNQFDRRIQIAFGWGTNLTNDVGERALSLVVKVSESCGHGTVKLSDNLAKAMGSPKDIERFKKIFGYKGNYQEECQY